jgi:hypothetical protein
MRGVETADTELRLNAHGRFTIALGFSIALHVVAFIVLVTIVRFSPSAYQSGRDGNIVLQAMLTADSGVPLLELQPIAVVEEKPSERRMAVVPWAPAPVEQAPAPAGRAESILGQAPGAVSGSPDPPVMITTRELHDLRKLPSSSAEILAQRFSEPVQKPPELRVPLLVLYPRDALDERRNARITAALAITENGEIAERTFIPDDPVFGPALAEALKDARFNPAEIDGRAVAYWAVIEFVFTVGQATLPKSVN